MRSSYVLDGKVLGLGLMASQGFRNKVFVIDIPRELGRSSFKKNFFHQKTIDTSVPTLHPRENSLQTHAS